MELINLISLIRKHNFSQHVLEWAGIFRYLGCNGQHFTLNQWQDLSSVKIHNDIAVSLIRILVDLGLLIKTNDMYHIINDFQLQRTFETIDAAIKIYPNEIQQQDKLLWTLPQGDANPPQKISNHFEYLNSWVQKIIQTTRKRLVFFAPYYSEAGIDLLEISLSELLKIHKNIEIDFIVSDIKNEENKKAFNSIGIKFPRENVKILRVSDESNNFSFHAKLLLSDEEKGYMGSANFSRNGLGRQFELGVLLNDIQTKTLTNLIDYWIRTEILVIGV